MSEPVLLVIVFVGWVSVAVAGVNLGPRVVNWLATRKLEKLGRAARAEIEKTSNRN